MSPQPSIRSRLRIVPCLLALTAGSVLAQPETGTPIVDVVERLRDEGLSIIYSDDLLPGRLRVTVSSDAESPIERLRDILAPHGLDVEAGPRDTWLVVRRPDAAAPGAEPGQGLQGLRLVPPSLETIIVTASRYAIERPYATSTTTIGRQVLENSAALGQDPLRVTHNLPGVSANDLSSQMHIRGGALDESLLILDGVRLDSPYHLKDFQNIFSSINPRVIESMDVRTGGYEARYGDRMSGVVDMRSVSPTEARHHEVAVSLLDTSVLSSGVFAAGRGSWVTSLRRGNLDVLSEAADSDRAHPQYVDFFNKLSYALSPRWDLSLGTLSLDDKVTLSDGDTAEAAADYDDSYLWLTLGHSATSGLETRIQIISTVLKRSRQGRIDDADRATGSLDESSDFDSIGLRADWSYAITERQHLSWGIEATEASLDHRFESERSMVLPITVSDLSRPSSPPDSVRVRLEQARRAVYVSYRLRLTQGLVAELGLRGDDQSLTDERQHSPRLNILFDLSDRTSLRAAWGRFFQSHSPVDLAVSDGSTELLPAEESEQSVLGIEHVLGENVMLRGEIYEKHISRLNHRFENLFERVSLIPELLPDRFEIVPLRAAIRGIEFSIEGGTDSFSWWTNVSRSSARESLASGRFDRSWDEKWALKAGGEWLHNAWTVTASAVLRYGWPITTLALVGDELVAGRFNDERLANFASLNVRASRQRRTEHGTIDWYVEISNLLDRANYCCLDYSYSAASGGQPASLVTSRDDLLGIVPNLGLRWQF